MVQFSKVGGEYPQHSYYHEAIRDNTLLGYGHSTRAIRHVEFLFHTKWPELAVTEKIPYSVHKVPEECASGDVWTRAGITISGDRRFLAHPDGRTVIYRRMEDLKVLWKFDAGAGLSVMGLAVSHDGGLMVLATARGAGDRTGPCYVAVLDGRNGQLLLKLPVYGDAGVAVSGERRLLVVGQATELDPQTSDTQSSLLLYDLGSGKHLETLNHYRRRIPRGAADMGTFGFNGIQFTPDGKYLVSSTATHTKVWVLK
jgi:WD40 repeat protein